MSLDQRWCRHQGPSQKYNNSKTPLELNFLAYSMDMTDTRLVFYCLRAVLELVRHPIYQDFGSASQQGPYFALSAVFEKRFLNALFTARLRHLTIASGVP